IDQNVVSSVLGMLGGASAGAGTTGASPAAGGIANAGALVEQLKAGGLASEVESWLGTGANKPVSPDALGQALGPQAVQQLSSSTGLSAAQLLPQLAALIPLVINHLTPNGNASSLTSGSGQDALAGLQGLLGGLANR
ncbi:MAG: YidB family protein, partial [Candidatus Limnocylindrales bacterium]